MIRPRIITIDCETLPEQTTEHTDEETIAYTDSSDIARQCSAPAINDAATGASSNTRDHHTFKTVSWGTGIGATGASSNTRDHHRSALNGDTGRLLCIGFTDEGGGRQPVKGVLGWNREQGCFTGDEAEILRDFWEMMRTFRPCVDRIVGHNIYNFDLPFIYKRSVICGVRPSIELNFARYRNQPIYDTMCEWEKWNLRYTISLDRLARVLGLESPKTNECDGSRIAELFARGEYKTIRDYCLKDVVTARRIYRRMTFADVPSPKPTPSRFEHRDSSRETTVASNFR